MIMRNNISQNWDLTETKVAFFSLVDLQVSLIYLMETEEGSIGDDYFVGNVDPYAFNISK